MHIDTKAVLEAAGTKWNFLKFYPGREEPQQSPPRPRREPAPRQEPKHQPTTQAEEEWDDLSDLDLSAYLDDDDEL